MTKVAYDTFGTGIPFPKVVTEPTGAQSVLAYDGQTGRLLESNAPTNSFFPDPSVGKVSYYGGYSGTADTTEADGGNAGLVKQALDPMGHATSYAYAALHPAGAVTPSAAFLRVTATLPDGSTTRADLNASGQPVEAPEGG